MDINQTIWVTGLLMSIRMTTPILFAGMGGLVSSRAGVFNLGLEGMMLFGAFFGYYGSLVTGSPVYGLLLAAVVGVLSGLLLSFFAVKLAVNQVVAGIGLNIVALGLTGYLSRTLIRDGRIPIAKTFAELKVPGLSDLPVIGPLLLGHTVLVYLAILTLAGVAWMLYRTTIGLNLRAVGEDPKTAATVGINVLLYRHAATVLSGVLASVGGAYITLVAVNRFLENIVEGRGWIAMAAVIFGRYTPLGVLGACFLFGAAEALQMLLQVYGVQIPYRIVLMTPYVLTMVVLAGFVGRVTAPAAQGRPYLKE
ncbi:MAG TPA: ABC transporter permease [Bacillota bacterium]